MKTTKYSDAIDELIDPVVEPSRIASGFGWAEGPVWDGSSQSIIFTDFPAEKIYRWNETAGLTLALEESGRSVGLALDKEGRILSCESRNHRVTRHEKDGTVVPLATEYQGKRLNSPNDVIVKSDGAAYFTDPYSTALGDPKELEHNGVYRVCPDTGDVTLLTAMERPNGLAFSPDEELLYIDDTNRQLVEVYTVREDGTLTCGKVFAQMDPEVGKGGADGMKLDTRGNLYVTGPGGVWVIDSHGTALGILHFPEVPANLCWGGEDLQTLYITATTSLYSLRTKAIGLVPGTRQTV